MSGEESTSSSGKFNLKGRTRRDWRRDEKWHRTFNELQGQMCLSIVCNEMQVTRECEKQARTRDKEKQKNSLLLEFIFSPYSRSVERMTKGNDELPFTFNWLVWERSVECPLSIDTAFSVLEREQWKCGSLWLFDHWKLIRVTVVVWVWNWIAKGMKVRAGESFFSQLNASTSSDEVSEKRNRKRRTQRRMQRLLMMREQFSIQLTLSLSLSL